MKIVINPIRPALSDLDQDFHVLVRLQSAPQAGFKRTPLNLALVIDRSGSMAGTKLREAKRCVIDLIQRMHPEDQVGLVQYDDQVDTVLPLTPVDQVSGVIDSLVQGITANGGTDLHAGWLRGGEMLAPKAGNKSTCTPPEFFAALFLRAQDPFGQRVRASKKPYNAFFLGLAGLGSWSQFKTNVAIFSS